MRTDSTDQIEPAVLFIQDMLRKIDRLHLPPASRRDLECILVRQVNKAIDRLLPWQAGHGQGTEVVALQIGRTVNLENEALHQLELAPSFTISDF
jgi:hypothetical protein